MTKQYPYADLHCDSLTACMDSGQNLAEFSGQINLQKLRAANCAVQCFAIFTERSDESSRFDAAYKFFKTTLKNYPQYIAQATSLKDINGAIAKGKTAAILTVENLSFVGENLDAAKLKRLGVCMASLVWNNQNQFAYPNLKTLGGAPCPYIRESRGLKEMGRQAIYQLNKNKIIIDVSHLSDGGVKDVLKLSSSPIVASHSAAAGVVNVSRNLTDEQIKAISDGGGVVGVNFCPTFVGASNMDGAVQNVLRLIDVGGEDVVAIGSDFDGMRRVGRVKDCTAIMLFFKKLAAKGVPPRVIEKVAIKNFLRLFYDVVG